MAFEDEIHLAQEKHKSNKPGEAEKIYRSILKRDPNHVEAARLLAGIAVEKSQYKDAEVFLRHAATIAPGYGRIWIDLTNVLRELEKLDDALECALKILEMAPEKAESHMLAASVVGAMSRHEDAIRYYEKALDIAPNRTGAMSAMAHHLKTVGRQQDGVAMYRKAIAAKPDHATATSVTVVARSVWKSSTWPSDSSPARNHHACSVSPSSVAKTTSFASRPRSGGSAKTCRDGK